MKLSNKFKIFWWALVLIANTIFLIIRFDNLASGTHTSIDAFLFLLWIVLILCPIFSEISFFGLSVKRELENLRNDIQLQITNLRIEIQNKLNLSQTISMVQSSTAIPPQAGGSTITPDTQEFKEMQKKILATLWYYQQKQFKDDTIKRWTFTVNPFAPDYPEYLEALANLVKIRLVAVSPENHQCRLTSVGIDFMKKRKDLQTENNLFAF